MGPRLREDDSHDRGARKRGWSALLAEGVEADDFAAGPRGLLALAFVRRRGRGLCGDLRGGALRRDRQDRLLRSELDRLRLPAFGGRGGGLVLALLLVFLELE